jgi:regulator of protease activity HflC (stomatin/prohibitin superfamily)
VKYVFGSRCVLLKPGVHLYWPIVTEIEICAVVRQVLPVKTQVLETQDGETVVASGLIVYEITDALTFLADNENAFETLDDVATAAIRKVVVGTSHRELVAGRAKLDNRLTAETQRLLSTFGVRVEYARLTDFARVEAYHLSGGPLVTVENHQP